MSNRFLKFLEEIASTDWEYSDGTTMVGDARKHLDEFYRIAELEQQLAEKDKQLFEENLQVKRLEQQLAEAHEELALSIKERIELGGKLSRYQGEVEVDPEVEPDEDCEAYKQGYRDGIHGANCRNPYPSGTADSWQWVYGHDQYTSERYVVD